MIDRAREERLLRARSLAFAHFLRDLPVVRQNETKQLQRAGADGFVDVVSDLAMEVSRVPPAPS